MAYPEGPGNIGQRLASFTPGQGLHSLMLGKLELAPEPHSPRLRSFAPLVGPSQDQMTLKLSQSPKDRNHQLAVWRGRIGPRIAERLEPRTTITDSRKGVE